MPTAQPLRLFQIEFNRCRTKAIKKLFRANGYCAAVSKVGGSRPGWRFPESI